MTIKPSLYLIGKGRSIVSLSSKFSEGSIVISDVESASYTDEQGISTFLAACLTANYISVGYLLVPWGKQPYNMIEVQ
jgi:hypothetical protein